MLPKIVDAKYVFGLTIWLRFSDGIEGEVDLTEDLIGPMFEPLRDPEKFRSFIFHRELRTIVWPNGADLAPEFLRSKLRTFA